MGRLNESMSDVGSEIYDVVIVGAGLAGLQCARKLLDGGLKSNQLLVLEAQEYKGGRTKQDSTFFQVFFSKRNYFIKIA